MTAQPEPFEVFPIGQRVAASPTTGAYAKGDVYGSVVYVDRTMVLVYMERSRKVHRFHPERIAPVGMRPWAPR